MPFKIITDGGIPALFSGIEKPNHAGIAAIKQPPHNYVAPELRDV
jgi:hypothetical protein